MTTPVPPPRPAPPPPSSGAQPASDASWLNMPQTTPPVGVREGDTLIIGVSDEMTHADRSHAAEQVRAAFGFYVFVLFVYGHVGVTVLRPER